MLDALPPAWAVLIMQVLGLPGLVFIIWHFDNKRFQRQEDERRAEAHRQEEERRASLAQVLERYRNDVTEIRRLYESNARLVDDTNQAFKRLETIYGEAIGVISLNTQAATHLADAIKNNTFCPVVRGKGPQG